MTIDFSKMETPEQKAERERAEYLATTEGQLAQARAVIERLEDRLAELEVAVYG